MFQRLFQSWSRLLKLLRLKRSEAVPLNVGILIIGSLFWDAEQNRAAWRSTRLDMATAQTVTAPIRYGRRSGKNRGYTYTMVFSRLAEPGHAKVVQCIRKVLTPDDLIAEAQALWKAEKPNAESSSIAAEWGCVALLCNPDRIISHEILEGWAKRVADEPEYGNVSQTIEEGQLIDKRGLLKIDWPHLVDGEKPVELDLLLATANDPEITATSRSYPTLETIANAWNAAASRYAEYFWRNAENGIRTFQDDAIRALLHPRENATSQPLALS